MFRRNTIYIYTDGSSLPRPRRGGVGIRYVYLDEKEEELSRPELGLHFCNQTKEE